MENSTYEGPKGFKYIFICLHKRRQTILKKEQERLIHTINLNYNLKENQRLNKKSTNIWNLIVNFILDLFNFK